MSIGKTMHLLRKEKGLSQEDLSTDLDISQSTISNYELGVSKPDIEVLQKYSKYFNVSISDIINDDNYTFYNHKNKGDNIGNIVYNQLSQKLFEQHDKNIEALQNDKVVLRMEIDRLLNLVERLSVK